MHLVWICLGTIAAAFLIVVGLVLLDIRKEERIAKDRDDGW